jgi:nitrite reductase/ring-hydroxylating ferredoxin subunit
MTTAPTHHPAEPRHWHEVPYAPVPGTALGHVDRLADGSVTMAETLHAIDGTDAGVFRYLLLRSGSNVRAYVNRCAHFGVPLAARQDLLKFQPHVRLTCNVHYAHYRWNDGVCTAGDCEGESLLSIPLTVDADGAIRIAP